MADNCTIFKADIMPPSSRLLTNQILIETVIMDYYFV